RVVRLSNVYGAGMGRNNFLGSLIEDAVTSGSIVMETALESAKDYVWIEDVVPLLVSIAVSGRHRLCNLASGHNVTNAEIVGKLKQFTGCTVKVEPNAPATEFPPILIDRVRSEFAFAPTPMEQVIEDLVRGQSQATLRTA